MSRSREAKRTAPLEKRPARLVDFIVPATVAHGPPKDSRSQGRVGFLEADAYRAHSKRILCDSLGCLENPVCPFHCGPGSGNSARPSKQAPRGAEPIVCLGVGG